MSVAMFKKYLLLVLLIFLYPNSVLGADVSKLFKAGSYDSAFRSGYADALSGDPESSFIIGKILIDGKGSAKENVSRGIEFIESSAKEEYLKAVIFLAKNYEEGNYTSENKSKALAYYEQCEKIGGSSKCSKKVTEISIASSGAISKKSCVRYNKKSKKNFYNVGLCISRNYLEGNASSYFLKAFDNGKNKAFLLASERMLRVKVDIDLMPIASRIPDFKRKATKSEINKFKKIINNNGYDASYCGKSLKKKRFSKPKTSSGGNDAACALAAEAGDPKAASIVYEWWKNGTNGFTKKKKYAESLLLKLETNDDTDIAELLKKYESEPKLHFKKAMEYIKAKKLNKSIVGKELKLELRLISQNKINDFADSYRDIADVIEYIDWKAVDKKTLAKFYVFYMNELKDEDDLLASPRVKRNIKKIPFSKGFIDKLNSIEDGSELGYEFLLASMFNNCDALNYVLENNNTLDIPSETLNEAQSKTFKKCGGKNVVAQKSMKELLEIAERELPLVKIFIEKRLNHKKPCYDYSEFLLYNRNPLDDFEVDYKRITSFCASFPAVSYKLASNAYNNKMFDEAYKYALQGCDNKDHPSMGCEIVASMLLNNKGTTAVSYSYRIRENMAVDYLELGHEAGDIKSTAMLYDFRNQPFHSKWANKETAKSLMSQLRKSDDLAATIRVKRSCFESKGDLLRFLTQNCREVCSWAKRNENNNNLDLGSKRALLAISKEQQCMN